MPGIEELYAVAVADGSCNSRVILAAGATRGHGALYARLRQEWDDAKASVAPGETSRRLAIVSRMQSMPKVRAILLEYVTERAAYRGYELSHGALAAIAWQAITLWLDPNCGNCSGRGSVPAKGDVLIADVVDANPVSGLQVICKHCKGSKKRSPMVGRTEQAQALIDAAVENLTSSVSSFAMQAAQKKYRLDDIERWIEEQTA